MYAFNEFLTSSSFKQQSKAELKMVSKHSKAQKQRKISAFKNKLNLHFALNFCEEDAMKKAYKDDDNDDYSELQGWRSIKILK